MTSSKIKAITMTAAVLVVMLVLLFASIIWLIPQFEIKDGKIDVPEYLDTSVSDDSTSSTAEADTDELTYKGTFSWEETDGGVSKRTSDCYLRIYVFDGETIAKFSFGEYLVDGWPVLLVSQSGNNYVFESSINSFVERVRINLSVTGSKISGTVKNITPEISTFVSGSFTGESITFEQYAKDVLD